MSHLHDTNCTCHECSEHEHHEHYQHDDTCTCHECSTHEHHHHHHEHHHEHGCTCSECASHEHEHTNGITVDNHEGALIGTLSYNSDLPYEELKNNCLTAINKLKEWAQSNRYLIGHIKGYVEKDNKVCTFSTTGHDVTTTELQSEPTNNNFNIICILFGATKENIEKELDKYRF